MADWNNPGLTSTYTDVLDDLKDRDTIAARMFRDETPDNLPVGILRWNPSSQRFQEWDGNSWQTVTLSVGGGGTGAGTAAGARSNLGATTLGSDLFTASSAASARSSLGATTVGSGVFTAGTQSAGRSALGGTSVGGSLFTAADASAARDAIGLVNAALTDQQNTFTADQIIERSGNGEYRILNNNNNIDVRFRTTTAGAEIRVVDGSDIRFDINGSNKGIIHENAASFPVPVIAPGAIIGFGWDGQSGSDIRSSSNFSSYHTYNYSPVRSDTRILIFHTTATRVRRDVGSGELFAEHRIFLGNVGDDVRLSNLGRTGGRATSDTSNNLYHYSHISLVGRIENHNGSTQSIRAAHRVNAGDDVTTPYGTSNILVLEQVK